jgi:cytoskeleton protein RodZ
MSEPSKSRAPAPGAGPGQKLHEARMRARLSAEQVAETLNLSIQQIAALEENDFARLPGPTYVRGYLRNYAQLLGLQPEEIIESYASVNGTHGATRPSTLTPEREVTTRDGTVRFATFLVVGILILLSVVWWQGRSSRLIATESGMQMQGQSTETKVAPEQREMASAPTISGEVGDTATSPSASAGAAEPPVPDVAAEPPIADVLSQESGLASSAPAAPHDTAQLVLHTRDTSWADIRDASGNKLLYMLVPAGRRITLSGVPPFTVFVGNPEGVGVEFNGKYIDAAQFKRGLVARFTLGTATPASN